MKEIWQTYCENAFGEYEQATFKFKQFDFNYKKFFPHDKNANLLDIGIGRGEMLTCFDKWGYKNHLGIDISPSTVKFCKSIGLRCELIDDTIEYLKNKPYNYDLITLLDVLEHVPRETIIDFLKAVHGSLKDNAILIIQVPNLQAPDGQLHMYNDITHMVGFIEHSLAQVLITAGFTNFHFQGFEEFTNNGIKTKVKKILRYFYWKIVRFNRLINYNLNPNILTPVFSAIVKKC